MPQAEWLNRDTLIELTGVNRILVRAEDVVETLLGRHGCRAEAGIVEFPRKLVRRTGRMYFIF